MGGLCNEESRTPEIWEQRNSAARVELMWQKDLRGEEEEERHDDDELDGGGGGGRGGGCGGETDAAASGTVIAGLASVGNVF